MSGQGQIKVRVVRAEGLKDADKVGGGSDPYVIVKVGTQMQKTSVINNTQNPVWNEEFTFNVATANGGTVSSDRISCEVYDKDNVGKGDPLGSGSADLQGLYRGRPAERVIPLTQGRLFLVVEALNWGEGSAGTYAPARPTSPNTYGGSGSGYNSGYQQPPPQSSYQSPPPRQGYYNSPPPRYSSPPPRYGSSYGSNHYASPQPNPGDPRYQQGYQAGAAAARQTMQQSYPNTYSQNGMQAYPAPQPYGMASYQPYPPRQGSPPREFGHYDKGFAEGVAYAKHAAVASPIAPGSPPGNMGTVGQYGQYGVAPQPGYGTAYPGTPMQAGVGPHMHPAVAASHVAQAAVRAAEEVRSGSPTPSAGYSPYQPATPPHQQIGYSPQQPMLGYSPQPQPMSMGYGVPQQPMIGYSPHTQQPAMVGMSYPQPAMGYAPAPVPYTNYGSPSRSPSPSDGYITPPRSRSPSPAPMIDYPPQHYSPPPSPPPSPGRGRRSYYDDRYANDDYGYAPAQPHYGSRRSHSPPQTRGYGEEPVEEEVQYYKSRKLYPTY
eukprot:TRINITY_DN4329_c0_g1_i1.p1 TRINITY_DN4329_c0_g1~~TRINITY_DN4329_c0_g1_i1.p1  ORF type:complete len:546 (+),score=37.62 TRINITY_DN4329_c0_g1_i1:106-1743(+)